MKYLLIILLFASCNPLKKAQQTFDANKPAAAEYCADRFPVKDSLIKGDTLVTTDTVYFKEYENVVTVDTFRTMPITNTRYITKTIRITDTIIRRDNAREQVLEARLKNTQQVLENNNTVLEKWRSDYYGMKDKRDKWRIRFFILLGLTIAYVGLRVKKLIPF
jgi:hypothetical protein